MQSLALWAAVLSACCAFVSAFQIRSISRMSGKALIVQNKGGGHGELGFHLASILQSKGIKVTLLQDSAASQRKQPFASYRELEGKGVEIIRADLTTGPRASLPEDCQYDYVFDNYAKDKASCQEIADAAKSWKAKNYVYVSSGGMYKDSDEVPFTESSDAKQTGQREVEQYAEEIGLPWTAFRPQYIYGPKTNKRDYLDWFFDRSVHGQNPYPLPLHGDQLTTLTHAEDVANMMAAVIDNSAAVGQVFNCANSRAITYNALAKVIASVTGSEAPKHIYYDPKACDAEKGYFPFRPNHFFVSSDKAMRLLNWAPKHDLLEDLKWYYDGYKAEGKADAKPDFSKDEQIVEQARVKADALR